MGGLVLFLTLAQIRVFFDKLAQNLAQITGLAITTNIMISRVVRQFLDLKVFLILKVLFYLFIVL